MNYWSQTTDYRLTSPLFTTSDWPHIVPLLSLRDQKVNYAFSRLGLSRGPLKRLSALLSRGPFDKSGYLMVRSVTTNPPLCSPPPASTNKCRCGSHDGPAQKQRTPRSGGPRGLRRRDPTWNSATVVPCLLGVATKGHRALCIQTGSDSHRTTRSVRTAPIAGTIT